MPTWDLLVCLQAFGSTSWGLLLLFIFVFVLAKQQNDNFRRQVLCGADLFKQKRSKYIFNHYTLLITRCGYSLCRSCAWTLRRAHGALEASKPWTQVPQNENESVYDHCKRCGSGDAPLGSRLGSTQPPLQQQRLCVVGLAWGGGGGESDAVL